MPAPDTYDPLADFHARYPDWRLDVGDTHGPYALMNPFTQRAVVDSAHLDVDQDFTIAYLAALLDGGGSWPLGAADRAQASKLANTRLGR